MPPKTPKLLDDIRDAAAFIRQATASRQLDDYRADRLLRQAVERNFEIIGEAMARITKHDPGTASQITASRQIIAFRNLLSHGYDLIDETLVWQVIVNDLPRLDSEVTDLLSKFDPE